MVKEGVYPVRMYYTRHDLNMCSELQACMINNREELVETLDWLGECRNGVVKLWTDNFPDHAYALFKKCYEEKANLFYEEMERII